MGFSRDPYDVEVAFDDIYGHKGIGVVARTSDVDSAARAIITRAAARRLTPQIHVVGADYDPTYKTFEAEDVRYRIIGDEEAIGLPLFDNLTRRFSSAQPEPKMVRVDSEESYRDFRGVRRQPYIAELQRRLEALEQAFALHVSDGHGIHGEDDFDVLGDAVVSAIGVARHGGQQVWLPLPDWADGKIDCWQDGPEILCTVRLPGNDGRPLLATTATQLNGCFEEVVGHADAADVEVEDLIAVAPIITPVLGASRLIPEICCVAGELIARGAPFVGKLTPKSDPRTAAAMALIQRCQRGDLRALREAGALKDTALFEDAKERLLMAQSNKANGRLS
jgi:hypothetical protein